MRSSTSRSAIRIWGDHVKAFREAQRECSYQTVSCGRSWHTQGRARPLELGRPGFEFWHFPSGYVTRGNILNCSEFFFTHL